LFAQFLEHSYLTAYEIIRCQIGLCDIWTRDAIRKEAE
jgi:hypothetical protein